MPGRSRRPATIDQVALAAGVSRATVSRVINGENNVSARSLQVVHSAIAELNYVPNGAARSLVTRRTGAVALVFAAATGGVLAHDYFGRIVRGVCEVTASQAIQVVLLVWESEEDRAPVTQFLLDGHVDGAILIALPTADPLPALLVASGTAVVVGGRLENAPPDIALLDVDNIGGARKAVTHLIAQGRRRIATITGLRTRSHAADRYTGWLQVLQEGGLEHGDDLVAEADFTTIGGEAAMLTLLEQRPDLDAVFVGGDDMALGALSTLRAAGRRVPEDVAVVGFDGSEQSRLSSPRLSTVSQPVERFGRELASLLTNKLSGLSILRSPNVPALLPVELVIRHSSELKAP